MRRSAARKWSKDGGKKKEEKRDKKKAPYAVWVVVVFFFVFFFRRYQRRRLLVLRTVLVLYIPNMKCKRPQIRIPRVDGRARRVRTHRAATTLPRHRTPLRCRWQAQNIRTSFKAPSSTSTSSNDTTPMDEEELFDVVVIGAGIGGLSAAALLAKYGLDVCCVESHEHAGGAAHEWKRQGFTFESGPSLYTGLSQFPTTNPLGQVLRPTSYGVFDTTRGKSTFQRRRLSRKLETISL